MVVTNQEGPVNKIIFLRVATALKLVMTLSENFLEDSSFHTDIVSRVSSLSSGLPHTNFYDQIKTNIF